MINFLKMRKYISIVRIMIVEFIFSPYSINSELFSVNCTNPTSVKDKSIYLIDFCLCRLPARGRLNIFVRNVSHIETFVFLVFF